MEVIWILLLCVVVGALGEEFGNFSTNPTKVHISYGDDPTQMIISWSTAASVNSSVVYRNSKQAKTAHGTKRPFRQQYFHRVTLKDLVPGEKYYYKCGSSSGWSKTFSFAVMKSGSDWSPRLVLFGDMGLLNARSFPYLEYETGIGMYDAALHVGDISYNLQDEDGFVGDQYQVMLEPISANVPYMMTVGNHDAYNNYSEYVNRFPAPGPAQGLFYSYNMGPAHIISLSTEFYYFYWSTTGFEQMANQFNWFIEDLKEATKPENRKLRPWIIVLGHRPMYCSNSDGDDCTWGFPRTRVGVPFLHWYGLEKPMHDYGVDIAIWAHEHSYERMWPIFNKKIYNGSYEEPYVNPKATVHLTTGSAGCQENHDPFTKDLPYYTAFRSEDYGYSRMYIENGTHIHWQQVTDKNGQVIDDVWIVQQKHGSFKH